MTKWHGSRLNVEYSFYRVDFDSLEIIDQYENITGGNLEWGAFTDTKADGELDYIGDAPDPTQLVRVVISFDDEYGTHYSETLGTYLVARPSPSIKPGRSEGSVEVTSILTVLTSRCYPFAFTVPSGTNAIDKAVSLIESCGLKVSVRPDADSTPGQYETSSYHTFDTDTCYLTIINWLIRAAGCGSLGIDALGGVTIKDYEAPTSRPVSWTFANDDTSTIYPEVLDEDNVSDKPNQYQYNYQNDTEFLWASATNNSTLDPSSTVNRKYVVSEQEELSELDGDTQEERIANITQLALTKMVDNLSKIYYRTITSAYVPVRCNDTIAVSLDGEVWEGNITNMSLTLSPSMPVEIKSRRIVTLPESEIALLSGVIYG